MWEPKKETKNDPKMLVLPLLIDIILEVLAWVMM